MGNESMTTISENLAQFIVETPFKRIPPELISKVQAYVLDLLGAALAGISELSSQAVVRAVLQEGGVAQATVFGTGRVAPMRDASLVNGTIAHALELDDDHRLGTVHPGSVVIPAALATSEATGCDGKTFLRAVLMGYEVMCRAGEAFLGRQYYQGFHPTSTCGVFGAAVASGVVLGLDHEQLVRAMGIAGTQAFGLGEWRADGSWIKRLHPGRAAHSGILACQLAREGFTGPATIFEGRDGFLRAFSHEGHYDEVALLNNLGRDFRMGLTAFKPYPGCRFAHAVIDIGLDLRREHGILPQDIGEASVRIYKTDILNYIPRPAKTVMAQFSVPYLLAVALVRGEVTLDHLTEESIRNPEVLEIADRISVEEDAEFTAAYPNRYSTEVTLKLKSGKSVSGFRDCPRGDPEAPEYIESPGQFETEVETKFRTLLKSTAFASWMDPMVEAVKALPTADNVKPLTALIGAPPV
jgi:2-methylcitrate dehydratase PrpD